MLAVQWMGAVRPATADPCTELKPYGSCQTPLVNNSCHHCARQFLFKPINNLALISLVHYGYNPRWHFSMRLMRGPLAICLVLRALKCNTTCLWFTPTCLDGLQWAPCSIYHLHFGILPLLCWYAKAERSVLLIPHFIWAQCWFNMFNQGSIML